MKRNPGSSERSFPFLRMNEAEDKPRQRGWTEIRGPYYSVVGRRVISKTFSKRWATIPIR